MKETKGTKTYTFNVNFPQWTVYRKNEFEVEIELSDSEVQELRELIDPVDDLTDGLMPILEDKALEIDYKTGARYPLYDKFSDAIFPKVFVELLVEGLHDGSIEKDPQDTSDSPYTLDPDLYDLYAPYIPCDISSYVCEIPKEFISKVYLTKNATSNEILRYLKREQRELMDSLYIDFVGFDNLSNEDAHDPAYWDFIYEKLSAIVSSKIQEATPEDLQRDDYNPLHDFDEKTFWKDYWKWNMDRQKK